MKFNSFMFLISLIMFVQSFAEEGGYLIKSTPTDVKVYIDDKLRAEQTPYTVILPEGKHILRIEKEGKQTITKDILISDKGIIKDEFILEDIPPPCPQNANFKEILYPQRNSFETEEEFLNRIKKSIERHNECTRLSDPRYAVAVGELHDKQYDIETGNFPITVHWYNSIVSEKFEFCSRGLFKIARDNAKALRIKNKEHPIFLHFEFDEKEKKAVLDKVLIKGEKRFYYVAIIQKWHNLRCSGKDF
jgi:hypothetical protein